MFDVGQPIDQSRAPPVLRNSFQVLIILIDCLGGASRWVNHPAATLLSAGQIPAAHPPRILSLKPFLAQAFVRLTRYRGHQVEDSQPFLVSSLFAFAPRASSVRQFRTLRSFSQGIIQVILPQREIAVH